MSSILERTTVREVLELTGNTIDQAEVKRNYKRLLKKWHPDVNKSPEAEEYTKRLNRAYALATGKEQLPQQAPPPPPQHGIVIIVTSYGANVQWTSGSGTSSGGWGYW